MIKIRNASTALAVLTAVFTTVASASPLDNLEGVWRSVGYGNIIEIKRDVSQMYHVTDISCSKGQSFSAETASNIINRVDRSEAGKMSYYRDDAYTRYEYTQLPALPTKCLDGLNDDPQYNFEVFWHAYDDHFAFFELRGVDWEAAYKIHRPKVTAETTQKELFDIFSAMLAPLKDGHVNLYNSEQEFNAGELGTLSHLVKLPEGNKHIPHVYTEDAISIIKDYIGDYYLKDSEKRAIGKGMFTWGWAAKGVGYISIDEMEGFVPETATGIERRDTVDEVMDRILTDLENADGIIVDVRWNGGGFDENGLTIAGHLTDQSLLAFVKKAKLGSGYTSMQQAFIPTHARKKYTGPVVLLQARDTFSAAETFSLAMQTLPNVTSIGENTGGSLSDVLGSYLPNGWGITISNEVYLDINGNSYERMGVPADITIPKAKGDTLETYLARGMDTAIEFLKKQ
ncbi:MAG: S41 family peptidase [Kordiimonadaceae bacterium]|nr:S41 family peptidase [Kordiimonadaceae bacterium]